jgi:hypothetical protein
MSALIVLSRQSVGLEVSMITQGQNIPRWKLEMIENEMH